MGSNKLYIFGGVVTAAVASLYIFLGPERAAKHKSKAWVKGLQNLGNTCFLNSVLQALAPCTSLTAWITNRTSERSILTTALWNILGVLNNESVSKTSPRPTEVLSALRLQNWVITHDEQDAHELFHVLTTTLEEEAFIEQSPLSLLEVGLIESLAAVPWCSPQSGILFRVGRVADSQLLPVSRLNLPTKGLLTCRLICRTCGFKNTLRYDSFNSISLTLPNRFWGSSLKLEQCLRQWASAELVPDVLCRGCSKKRDKTTSVFTKQLSFGKFPACLCLHLIRTVWLPTGVLCKRSEHVAFPEYLNLSEYGCLPCRTHPDLSLHFHSGLLGGANHQEPSKLKAPLLCKVGENEHLPAIQDGIRASIFKSSAFTHLYELKSVIVHIGDTFSGHFITYRRGPKCDTFNNTWFCVSDMSVKRVPFSEVLKASAYMLLYERL